MAAAAAAGVAAAADRSREFRPTSIASAAGFGVRVVHSGVWGFASSPIVTEDEIRRITRVADEVAKASAIAKKSDLKLAQVPSYVAELRHADDEAAALGLADRQAGVGAGDRRQGEGRRRASPASTSRRTTAMSGATSRRARGATSSRSCTRRRRTSPSPRRLATSRARETTSASRPWAVGKSPRRRTSSMPPSVWRPRLSRCARPSRSARADCAISFSRRRTRCSRFTRSSRTPRKSTASSATRRTTPARAS